jgi:hypothetical protein
MTPRRVAVGEARASFELPLSCAAAFPLFTPLGERRWAPGWNPDILVGDGFAPAAGDVFETEGHGRRFLWTVAEVDRPQIRTEHFRIKYLRAAEGFQLGEVEVQCAPVADASSRVTSRVTVRYRLVGLGDQGAHVVDAFFAPGTYEDYIAGWQREIQTALARESR